jgi:hypothetical protein
MTFDELLAECVTTKPGISVEKLPDVLRGHTAGFLPICGQATLGRSSKSLAVGFKKDLLKPNLKGDPAELFKNPENRLDRYVPLDEAGRNYLKSLGIEHQFLINQIQEGRSSIKEAINVIHTGQRKLAEWIAKNGNAACWSKSGSLNCYYIECGWLEPSEVVACWRKADALSIVMFYATQRIGMHHYLDKGELLMKDVVNKKYKCVIAGFLATNFLEAPVVQQYIEKNKVKG